MSEISGHPAVPTTPPKDPHAGAHDAHGHPKHLAHHFDTPYQQYASAKLGMWVFLGTEILMFGGLFCAYGVYRHNHPDVFVFAHKALDPLLGGINTVVLITSSLTMALAVRYAQLGRTTPLVLCLALTILGGAGFMGIKFVEYKSKWEHHLFPGRQNVFNPEFEHKDSVKPPQELGHLEPAKETETGKAHDDDDEHASAAAASAPAPVTRPTTAPGVAMYPDPLAGTPDEPKVKPQYLAPTGLTETHAAAMQHRHLLYDQMNPLDRTRINTFFSVYFCMTGLHGIHVLIGMGLIGWVMLRARRGEFSPEYFTPVDLVGLYWHLVDLIWIFLFPLLYLIH